MLGDDPAHPLGVGDGDLHAHRLLAGAAEDDIDADIPEHRDNGFMNPHHRLPINPPGIGEVAGKMVEDAIGYELAVRPTV